MIRITLALGTLCVCGSIYGMTSLAFNRATIDDCDAIHELINTQAIYEKHKLVILPKKFRKEALQKTIENRRLFIARDTSTNKVIGFQKLYLVPQDEVGDMLLNEIRCVGDSSVQHHAYISKDGNEFSQKELSLVDYPLSDIYIYNGGSFTHPAYRQRGVNRELTEYAYKQLSTELSLKNPLPAFVLLYGLTKYNAGEEGGFDRSPSLLKSFKHFLELLDLSVHSCTIEQYRYLAFKPSFDPDSETCEPLPDDQSVPGYGSLVRYTGKLHDKVTL